MKRCSRCNVTKTSAEFHRRTPRRGRPGDDRLQNTCKACQHERYKRNRAKYLEASRVAKAKAHGLTVAEADAIRAQPCAICAADPPNCVDHDHATGAVRGALCNACNVGLGHFRDSPTALQRAIDYLLGGHGIDEAATATSDVGSEPTPST